MKTIHVPKVNGRYWLAILLASVFGTNMGDLYAHESGLGLGLGLLLLAVFAALATYAIGEGPASICLGLLLGLIMLVTRSEVRSIFTYWGTVAVARTAGTAIGDWLAENRIFDIGLPLSTLLTGTAFVAVLLIWRSRADADLRQRGELR